MLGSIGEIRVGRGHRGTVPSCAESQVGPGHEKPAVKWEAVACVLGRKGVNVAFNKNAKGVGKSRPLQLLHPGTWTSYLTPQVLEYQNKASDF